MNNHAILKLDKERTFKLNYNTLCYLEDMGYSLEDINKDGKVSFRALRGLVYAGLKADDAELTIEQVGEMLTLQNTQEVADALTNLMGNLKE